MELKNTIIGLAIVLILGSSVYAYKNYVNPSQIQIEESKNPILLNEEKPAIALLLVHIEGAVKNPGVYKLKHGDRIINAIEVAGGNKVNANLAILNLAEKVKDGQKITVPEIVKLRMKRSAISSTSGSYASAKTGLVSINSATQKELETLKGVGPSTAKRIVQYRNENGAFSKLEDLVKVKRIGKKSFEKLKSRITL